jgi:CRISPR-associated protein Csb2
MTTLGIHYLTGYAVAMDRAQSEQPEFPPHFGRVFMALAAAHFETRGNKEERAALEWLEAAEAPSIKAGTGYPRSANSNSRYEPVKTYVPVNDKLEPDAGILLRSRQSRSFATMRLDDPVVYLRWQADIPENLRDALERLCSKVTRIGHSSSLVQMWVADEAAFSDGDCWQPSDTDSDMRMRIAGPGTLAYLERVFNEKEMEEFRRLSESWETATGKLKKEIKNQLQKFPKDGPKPERPVLTRWQGYIKPSKPDEKAAIQCSPFDSDLIVLTRKDEQRVFGLEATLQLTSALRDAAMKAVGDNVPEWLSGHQPDGRPSLKAHAAFFPLPFVGARYADGHIMGMAMAVPREIESDGETREVALRRVLAPLLFRESGEEKTVRLWRNKDGHAVWEWELEREKRDFPPVSLRARTWTRASTEWASVTPVVLHHYPKRGRENDVERIVLEAFKSAGLPRPVSLRVQPVSLFEGAGHVRTMPEFTEGGEKMCRYQVHVVARFTNPVQGPLLVGRGRFRGYGLLRPVEAQHG